MRINRALFLSAAAAIAGCSSSHADQTMATECEQLCQFDVNCHGERVRPDCMRWCESSAEACTTQWKMFASCAGSIEDDFVCSMDEGTRTLLELPGCEQPTAELEACTWFATTFCQQQCIGFEGACHSECADACYQKAAACLLGGSFSSFSFSCGGSSSGGGGFSCDVVATGGG